MKPNKKTATYNLPLVFTRGQVIFPGDQNAMIDAGRKFTLNAIDRAYQSETKYIVVVAQKVYTTANPKFEDVFHVGTLCEITRIVRMQNYVTMTIRGLERVELLNAELIDAAWMGDVEVRPSIVSNLEEIRPLFDELSLIIRENPEITYQITPEVRSKINNELSASDLADIAANFLINATEQKQQALEIFDVKERLEYVIDVINSDQAEDEVRSIAEAIKQEEEKASTDKTGEDEDDDDEEDLDTTEEIIAKLRANPYPKPIKRKVRRELRRLGGNEADRMRALDYIDWLLKIPYWQETIDNNDLKNVQTVLDEDHYGLEDAKKRIIEYIAVKEMTNDSHSPIICFYGEPGTGKTSLAKSIARALGRKLVKGSLGGVDDEAKIRGFLRTYVGAQPGMIIQAMKRAGTINPVFILDEVDKLGASRQGDPSAALLEVLDPEQNKQFNDHYIEEDYDLSRVMFIATANNIENIPPALRDRMEMIYLPPYTEDEKINIATKHLIPKEIKNHGLEKYGITLTRDAVITIINHYTLEAGVRALSKQIASILRKLSVEILQEKKPKFKITSAEVRRYLGDELVLGNKKQTHDTVGVVTGLAVIGGVGGDILPVEVSVEVPGRGNVNVTGNLRDLMKESGMIAMGHVRSFANHYGIDPQIFEEINLHLHFPDAAPKDGNSAGIAMGVGIISALTGRKVKADVCMTGEISLMGKALRIGGVREKLTGALRAGMKKVLIPRDNERDLKKVPDEVKNNLEIIIIDTLQDAVQEALSDEVEKNQGLIDLILQKKLKANANDQLS
ncbi:MAG: endopeptidase La [Bacilli bacterium]